MIESPFGSVKPENLPPAKPSVGRGAPGVRTSGRKKRASVRVHYDRVIKLMEQDFGGFFWPCDGKKVGAGGALVSTDLLGFMDIQGIVDGRLIAANVTSKAGMGAHMRDYTNPAKTHGAGKIPVCDLLRKFLRNGGSLYIYGYEKKGPRWHYDVWKVDEALMAQYEARKRGAVTQEEGER